MRKVRQKIKLNERAVLLIIAAAVFVCIAIISLTWRTKEEVQIEARIGRGKEQVIRVYQDGQVEEIPLEEYLVGVVAGEMPASYELEALKAQAVAARTYTAKKIQDGGCGRDGADICTDHTHCQAYRVDIPEESKEKLTQAVEGTREEVLLYDGTLITALYHSTSGGQTEDNVNVFGANLPYLKSVESEGEENYPQYTRQKTVTIDQAKRLTEEKYGKITKDTVTIQSRLDSGRVEQADVFGHRVSGKDVRELFALASANFTVEEKDGQLIFTNIGFGHGVGLSQVGADAMAKRGAGYREILTHYYTGVEIHQLKP